MSGGVRSATTLSDRLACEKCGRVHLDACPGPQRGDRVLGCEHAPELDGLHFWFVPDPMPFRRPDGTTGFANWIVACDACACRANFDGGKVAIKTDCEWDDTKVRFRRPS